MSKAATHAMAETTTAEMADPYDAVVETHAVIDDVPPGTHAMAEAVAEMGETYAVIDATTHAMVEAAAQFAVLAMAQPIGSVRIAVPRNRHNPHGSATRIRKSDRR